MKLIAHRGNNNHGFRENTKEALISCLNTPYIDGVECDVRLTKDKKIVLHHDMTINRTSNGSGFLALKTLRELKKYNFGTSKHPQKITTLKEFVSEVSTNKIILIELKSEDFRTKELVHRLIKICKKYPLNYYFFSFRYDIVKYMKKKYPKLKVGIIVGNGINYDHQEEFDFVGIEKNKYQGKVKEKFIWTINNKKQAKLVANKSIYVLTDKAYLFKKWELN